MANAPTRRNTAHDEAMAKNATRLRDSARVVPSSGSASPINNNNAIFIYLGAFGLNRHWDTSRKGGLY